MFEEIIGQEHIKSSLSFYAESAKKGSAIPPILFTGARGLGKTMIAREFGKILKRPVLEINCSTIKNNSQFFEQVFVPIVMDNEIVLIFDEAHALPKDLQNAFLTVFNVEKTTKKHFEWQGSTMQFDFVKQTYLFATTEPDKIFVPLKDRFEEINFRPYLNNELSEILNKRIGWVSFENGLMSMISTTLRGNARSAVKRSKQIEMYCESKNISKFGEKEWKDLCGILGINSHGLTNTEIEILHTLKTRGDCTLAMLSAATGLSRTAIQRDAETYLLRKALIKIEGARKITPEGTKVLACV
jgi:Holliday junction resolvasome RuvABC ATP-dependent DNA helicase subunit